MTDITPGSANIYRDLGYDQADSMALRAKLTAEIRSIMQQRRLTQSEVAQIVAIPQPKLSAILRGQFRGVSETKLLRCLNALGRDVEIVVRATPKKRAVGSLKVVIA